MTQPHPRRPSPFDATCRVTAEADDLLEAWREASADAAAAYRDWSDAPRSDARMAYSVYVASADREAAAARLYERVSRLGAGGMGTATRRRAAPSDGRSGARTLRGVRS